MFEKKAGPDMVALSGTHVYLVHLLSVHLLYILTYLRAHVKYCRKFPRTSASHLGYVYQILTLPSRREGL